MRKIFTLIGQYLLLMKKVFRKPERSAVFWKQFVQEIEKTGLSSVPIVGIVSIFIGAVITIQTSYNINSPLIPKSYIGFMTRETMLLEFSSTMIALVLAGKIGSSIASEIGTMRITEQIDALEIMGVNSANYLILPKITAATIFNPLLMLMSFMIGLLGGWMMALTSDIVNPSQYIEGLRMNFQPFYIVYGLIKMAVFNFIITSISAFHGYYASGGSRDVGRSATNGIVSCSLCILISNLILTHVLL
ncbi:MAG: ABC transporter permease [Prevotellaceae bacterium]|jgi:phospholipid/cholesterol/gamma-HCH transport system permease protein|nr:ABC transporter permease [Prevotellaceae bacterium]